MPLIVSGRDALAYSCRLGWNRSTKTTLLALATSAIAAVYRARRLLFSAPSGRISSLSAGWAPSCAAVRYVGKGNAAVNAASTTNRRRGSGEYLVMEVGLGCHGQGCGRPASGGRRRAKEEHTVCGGARHAK